MATPNRQGGLIRIATDIAQQGRVEGVPSSGAGEAIAGLSRHFSRMGQSIGQMADQAAAIEGEEAGRLAGLDPEFRPTRSLTIRGQAYDKAGLQVAGTRMKQGMEADLAAAYDALGNDPAKLDAALNEKGNGWLSQAPPEVRPALEAALRGAKITYMRQSARAQVERIYNDQQAAQQTEISEGIKGMHQRAYSLGLDAEADAVMATDIGALDEAMARTDVTGKRLMSPEVAAKIRAGALETIATARLSGAFDRLNGIAAKEKFIQQFEDDFANSRGLAKQYDLQGFQSVSGALREKLSKTKTAGAVAARAIEQEAKRIVSVLQTGGAIPPEQIAGLEAQASSVSATPEVHQSVAELKGLFAYQQQVRGMSPGEHDAVLSAQRENIAKNGVTRYAAAELELGEKLQRARRTRLKDDMLGWASDSGVADVPALDFATPETAATTLQHRIAVAEEVAAKMGVAPQYLTPDEKQGLVTMAAPGGEDMLRVATMFAGAGDRAPAILADVFKEAPALAMLGGLALSTGATRFVTDAANGFGYRRAAREEGGGRLNFSAPTLEVAREHSQPVYGQALAEMPKSETALIELTRAAYEARAQRNGITEFDEELWAATLNEAIGQREIGGDTYGGVVEQYRSSGTFKVIIPPNVKQERWDELRDAITLGDLDEAGIERPIDVYGRPMSISALRSGVFVNVGDGQYAIALGNPMEEGEERWLMADPRSDRKFVLDVKALEPILRKRHRGLFLGDD